MLTNDVVSFEQLGPELQIRSNQDNLEIIYFILHNICCDHSSEPSYHDDSNKGHMLSLRNIIRIILFNWSLVYLDQI